MSLCGENNRQLLDDIFVISKIIKVDVGVRFRPIRKEIVSPMYNDKKGLR